MSKTTTGNGDSECKLENPKLLFITGIPSRSSPKIVLDFFRQYGEVQLHRLPKEGEQLKNHSLAKGIRRGFCILSTKSIETYKVILALSETKLYTRTLGIYPFENGQQLNHYNEIANSKRIILKKVPSSVPESDVWNILQTSFGKVRRLYRFESESVSKANKKARNRRTYTYSAEFESGNYAEMAALQGSIVIGDIVASIERFQKSRKDSSDPKINYDSTKVRFEIDNQITNISGYSSSLKDSLVPFCAVEHCSKPTTTRYYFIRATTSAISSIPTMNLRFNIIARRCSNRVIT